MKIYNTKTNMRIYAQDDTLFKFLGFLEPSEINREIKTTATLSYMIAFKNSKLILIDLTKNTKPISLEQLNVLTNKPHFSNTKHNLKDTITELNKAPKIVNIYKVSEDGQRLIFDGHIKTITILQTDNNNIIKTVQNETKNGLTTNIEDGLIKKYINIYLKRLNLKEIESYTNNIYKLSSIGDKLFSIDLLERGFDNSWYNFAIQNSYQKQILILLGLYDFHHFPDHLAGSFFETIYYIIKDQKNKELENLIMKKLSLLFPVNEIPIIVNYK